MKEKIAELKIESLKDIKVVAEDFLKIISDEKIILMDGNMGAGKTTFIKSVCEVMGVEDAISSPTFSIVNEYKDRNDKSIFHFDCYRIENNEQAFDIGFEEYLESGAICFIEWGENINDFLPYSYIQTLITEEESGNRKLELFKISN